MKYAGSDNSNTMTLDLKKSTIGRRPAISGAGTIDDVGVTSPDDVRVTYYEAILQINFVRRITNVAKIINFFDQF